MARPMPPGRLQQGDGPPGSRERSERGMAATLGPGFATGAKGTESGLQAGSIAHHLGRDLTMADPSKRCPECGRGTLVDIAFREGRAAGGDDVDEPLQSPETHQVETYSCGHEVIGPRLDATAADPQLSVERRESDETAGS
jgi:hypothetical protein